MGLIHRFLMNQDMKLFKNYLIIAIFVTIIDVLLFYSITEFLHVWYIYSALISYMIALFLHYSLNKYLNFKNKSKKHVQQFGLFVIVSLIGLGFHQIILYSLVEFTKLWYMYAKIITILIVSVWNFNGNKHLTFKVFK